MEVTHDITQNMQKCCYCGKEIVITPPYKNGVIVECPHCGKENNRKLTIMEIKHGLIKLIKEIEEMPDEKFASIYMIPSMIEP